MISISDIPTFVIPLRALSMAATIKKVQTKRNDIRSFPHTKKETNPKTTSTRAGIYGLIAAVMRMQVHSVQKSGHMAKNHNKTFETGILPLNSLSSGYNVFVLR